ncbi:MAG: hypothetical protein RIM33_17125 [Alphaproteobacteria bacterium]
MSKDTKSPEDGADFPEETHLRDGPMDHEILAMVVEALNKQGHPDVSMETVYSVPEHKDLAIDLLRDCRPMPVVLDLIAELESR